MKTYTLGISQLQKSFKVFVNVCRANVTAYI